MILAVLAVAATGTAFAAWSRPGGETLPADLVFAPVERGPLEITVAERGRLESRSNVTLTSRVGDTTTIIYLVPEGTRVAEGDLVCELDSSVLREEEADDRMDLTEAEAALEQAEKELEITIIENQSAIAQAKVEWDLAVLDLESYTHEDGEYAQLASEAEGDLELAKEDLRRAEENLAFTERMARRGYRTQNEVEADRLAVRKAELSVDTAYKTLKVLTDFTQKRTVAEYTAAAKDLKLEYERAKLKAEAARQQAVAEVEKQTLLVKVQKIDYEDTLKELEACTIHAPQAGTVVYASERGRGGDVIIEEGSQVRRRQAIIKIPDLTRMKVEARIHESRIRLIDVGLRCDINVDAVPGRTLAGRISKVASVPASSSWRDGDNKYYDIEVEVEEDDPDVVDQLRPGLTARLEVQVDRADEAIQVPVQSIVAAGGVGYAFVREGDHVGRREVVTGRTNDRMIEILHGLEPGEAVVMNPRTRFATEIAELDAAASAATGMMKPGKREADSGEARAEKSRPAPGKAA